MSKKEDPNTEKGKIQNYVLKFKSTIKASKSEEVDHCQPTPLHVKTAKQKLQLYYCEFYALPIIIYKK